MLPDWTSALTAKTRRADPQPNSPAVLESRCTAQVGDIDDHIAAACARLPAERTATVQLEQLIRDAPFTLRQLADQLNISLDGNALDDIRRTIG